MFTPLCLSVCLSVCLFVSRITQKRMDRFPSNFVGRLGIIMAIIDYIFRCQRSRSQNGSRHAAVADYAERHEPISIKLCGEIGK